MLPLPASSAGAPAIEAVGLEKRFGDVAALDGLDLVAPAGAVTAVLGPNGAGKTTFVSAVATLHRPDAGTLRVAGIDAVAHAEQVRRVIGLAGQHAAVEPALTGRENLVMVARLFGHGRRGAQRAADIVLGQIGLTEAADRLVRGYSGRHAPAPRPRCQPRRGAPAAAARRADDRPRPAQPHRAVGRHPRARRHGHRRAADDAVPRGGRPAGRPHRDHRPRPIDRHRHAGRAEGPRPGRTWSRCGCAAPTTSASSGSCSPRSATKHPASTSRPAAWPSPVADGTDRLAEAVRLLADARIAIDDVGLRRPTLDEVFLALTGRPADAAADAPEPVPA